MDEDDFVVVSNKKEKKTVILPPPPPKHSKSKLKSDSKKKGPDNSTQKTSSSAPSPTVKTASTPQAPVVRHFPPPAPTTVSMPSTKPILMASPSEVLTAIRSLERSSVSAAATSDYIISGLVNSRNSCFRNVILQALVAVEPLRSDKAPLRRNASINPEESLNQVNRLFQQHTSLLFADSSDSRQRQEDAMEYLTFMLDRLHEELVRFDEDADSSGPPSATEVSEREGVVEDEWETVGQSKASAWSTGAATASTTQKPIRVKKLVVDKESRLAAVRLNDSSLVSRLFHGTLRSEVLYSSSKLSSCSFQRFHCLSLDIGLHLMPTVNNSAERGKASDSRSAKQTSAASSSSRHSSKPTLSLEQVLANHFRAEVLAGDKPKDRLLPLGRPAASTSTSTSTASQKIVVLEVLPAVFILQLNRFTFNRHTGSSIKLHHPVHYPLTLTLHPTWLSADLRESTADPKYSLAAVVMHHGENASGGHYTAYTRDGRSQWHHFDDSTVTSVHERDAVSGTECGYILVYLKQ